MGLFDSIGALFGDAPNNANFTAQSAPIINATTAGQTGAAYDQSQGALAQQQALMQALQNQNGIGNQGQVYNQLQGVVGGTGPNPAQAMLNQATGANTANQAALMAGQRGAGANVGLMARQAAEQGAANQQNAIGQGATLQAQQSLGALGQAGGLANQQAANQIGAVGNYNQLAQNQQQMLLNALGAQNNANVANTSNMNSANAGMAQTNANNTAKLVGGLFQGAAGAMAGGAAGGGVVTKSGPLVPSHLKDMQEIYHGSPVPMRTGGVVPGGAKSAGDSPRNDTVDAKLSPGEVVIPKSIMESDDPASRAAKFVADLIKRGAKSPEGEFKDALRKAISGRKKK